MGKRVRIIILTILMILMIGCSANDHSNVDSDIKGKVTIRQYFDEPGSFKSKDTIVIKGVSKGEFVEIVIEGKIKDFQLVKLEWDNIQNNTKEKEVLKSIDSLTDKTIVIQTYAPEGIPLEKIKWKSLSGKDYEYVIHEQGIEDESGKEGTVYLME